MEKILAFPDAAPSDLHSMNRQALLARLDALREEIAALDAQEPANMASEAYEEWGAQHEELEDLLDEILDRLDELD